MKNSAHYWNLATIAAIMIGTCNVLPNYADALFSTTIFSSISIFWKLITSFLILYYIGKRIVAAEIVPSEGYTYGRAFGWCYLSSLLAGIVEGFFSVIYAKFIVPDFIEKTKNLVMNIMSENPSYTPEMISMAEKNINAVLSPMGLILSSILAAAIAGAIMSLIVASFIKKNPDIMADD